MKNAKTALNVAVKENILIFKVTLLCILSAIVSIPYIPAKFNFSHNVFDLYYTSWNGYSFIVTIFYTVLIGLKQLNLLKTEWLKSAVKSENIISAVFASICIFICLFCFCLLKRLIPFINPFSWDPLLFKLDSLLLLGHDTYTILNNFGSPNTIKYLCNLCYTSWPEFCCTILLWQHISPNRKLRLHYMTTWLASWLILGCYIALIFASVGPCFYSNFYKVTPPLIQTSITKLNNSNNKKEYLTDTAKKVLIETTSQEENAYIGFSISAFPSLHVGTTTINACFLSKVNKRLGILAWIFTFLTILSCAYLGFHYLIDCIAGLIGCILLWHYIGKYIEKEYIT